VEAEAQLNAAIGLDPASDSAHASLAEVYASNKHTRRRSTKPPPLSFLRGQREQALKIKATYEKSGYEAASQLALRER